MPIAADTVHHNARIHTLDPARPRATALAVANGQITAVGHGPELFEQMPAGVERVDHGGAVLVPGLADVHNHMLIAGRADLFELRLDGSAGLPAVLDAIRARAATLPEDGWLVGGGWSVGLIPELSGRGALARLDQAAGGRPVLLRDDSCHNRWVSSAVLALTGIGPDTPDPADGTIVRDPSTREPTGVLIESAGIAAEQTFAALSSPGVEQDAAAVRRAVQILNSHGVTAFQDAATSLELLTAIHHLDGAGDLHAWAVTSMQVNDKVFGTHPLGQELIDRSRPFRSSHHRPDFVKIFLDGIPPTRTAAFLAPYLPADGYADDWSGATLMDLDELTGWLLRVAEQGLSAKIHCTGDRSVRMVIDAAEKVRAAGHDRTRIHLAHGTYVDEGDVPRIARFGLVADLSPALWFPNPIVEAICACVPRERGERIHPNRSLLDAGVLLAGGSDWPVAPTPNPWIGMQGLVTRADPFGGSTEPLWPEQAITAEQALHVYTLGAAQAMGLDDVTGSLQAGRSADFAELDRDPVDGPADRIAGTVALRTWFAGRQVHGG